MSSLSLNVVLLWRVTITGAFQAFWSPVAAGLGPKRQRRVAVRGHAVLEVVGQRVDRADVGGAVLCGQAAVGRLGPALTAVEGEVDAGDADVGGEVATAALARGAVDQVIGARRQHVGVVRIDRECWLVDRIGKVGSGGAGDRDLGLGGLGTGRHGDGQGRCYRHQRQKLGETAAAQFRRLPSLGAELDTASCSKPDLLTWGGTAKMALFVKRSRHRVRYPPASGGSKVASLPPARPRPPACADVRAEVAGGTTWDLPLES